MWLVVRHRAIIIGHVPNLTTHIRLSKNNALANIKVIYLLTSIMIKSLELISSLTIKFLRFITLVFDTFIFLPFIYTAYCKALTVYCQEQ